MDRGAWWAIYSPWGHKELDMTEQLSFHFLFTKEDIKMTDRHMEYIRET